jgi:MFS family permease
MLNEDSYLSQDYDNKFIYQAFSDYKTYHQIAIFIGTVIPVYAIALFTPTIVKDLGYSAARAQLLTVPPFVAGCIATIIVGILSDRYNLRGPFIVGGSFVSLIGYIVLYTQSKPGVAYVGAILSAMGVFPVVPVSIAWAGGNAGGSLKRGVVLAMVIGISNLGGFVIRMVWGCLLIP